MNVASWLQTRSLAMAPKKSESSAAAGAGINAVRRVAAHVSSRPEGAPSGRPQPKVSGNICVNCNGRCMVFEFDARVGASKLRNRTAMSLHRT